MRPLLGASLETSLGVSLGILPEMFRRMRHWERIAGHLARDIVGRHCKDIARIIVLGGLKPKLWRHQEEYCRDHHQ